eukprot:2950188-Karenia_brevis.AAC.1
MATDGDPGPPNSPLGSVADDGSQYGGQHGSGAGINADSQPSEGSWEDKVLKMVSVTVKGMLGELLPQLLKSQQGTKGTYDDKKGKLEE